MIRGKGVEQRNAGALRKERLVPDRRIRRGFRLELALNQALKIGRNAKKGHSERRELSECRNCSHAWETEIGPPAGSEAVLMS